MHQENLQYMLEFQLKSGVGGGIIATVPRRFGIGIYGPALDDKGNSIAWKLRYIRKILS